MATTQRLTNYQPLAPAWSFPTSRILSPVLSRSNSELYTCKEYDSDPRPSRTQLPSRPRNLQQQPPARPAQPRRPSLPQSNTYRQQRSRRISRSPKQSKQSTDQQPAADFKSSSAPTPAPAPQPAPAAAAATKKQPKAMSQNQAGGTSRKISFNVSEQYDIQDVVGEGAYGVVWYVSSSLLIWLRHKTNESAPRSTSLRVKRWPSKRLRRSSTACSACGLCAR